MTENRNHLRLYSEDEPEPGKEVWYTADYCRRYGRINFFAGVIFGMVITLAITMLFTVVEGK